jgi:predicted lysophospholipase L1 biosynthesis ABC-type transport system permease subunit
MYWRYATRSLARGGQRTLLAIFCVAVGVMAIVSLQLVGNMVNDALTGNIRADNGGDVSVRTDITPLNAQDVTQFAKLQDQGVLTASSAVDNLDATSHDSSGHLQRYPMYAVDPSTFPLAGAPVFVTPSNGSLSSLLQNDNVVVTDALLSQMNAHVGDSLNVNASGEARSVSVTIAGVIKGTGFFQGSVLLVSLNDWQAVPSTSGTPVGYNVVYANVPGHTDANEDAAKKAIQNVFPLATVTTTKDALQQNQTVVNYVRDFLQIIGLLALLIGGVGIINTMQVLLRRRRVEIAMLKTEGYRQADLYSLFGLEAALLGLVGGVLGSAAGVGISFVVRTIVENTINLQLPATIDPVTVASGVAIGLVTALIFGILPIVQSSQVRPQAVLREEAGAPDVGTIGLTLVLGALVAVLFFLLTWVILQNYALAAYAVIGAAVFLGVLAGVFALIVWGISSFPVVERFRWWYVLMIVVGLGISGLITWAAPPLGSIFVLIAVAWIIVVLLPRTWKSNVKMALRNLGRSRARTVTTLVALYIGVFSIGLILALAQDVEGQITGYLNTHTSFNTLVFATSGDKAAVDTQIANLNLCGSCEVVNTEARVNPISVDGAPIGTIIGQATSTGGATALQRDELLAYLSAPEGYDLASNQTPNVTIVKGQQDSQVGHMLTSADANTNNVILPLRASYAPLDAHLNSQVVLASQDGKTTLTANVEGFYTSAGLINLGGGGMYADNSLVNTISGGHPAYIYSLKLDPNKAQAQVSQIENAVPTAQAITLASITNIISNVLNDIVITLTALASLAMFAGIVIIANAVALAMLERRRELGILKAVGHTSGDVLGEVLIENGIVGFTGGLLAMLLVTAAIALLDLFLFKSGFGVGALITVGIIFASAAVCMVVAALVAWSATRVRPIEVLRYE